MVNIKEDTSTTITNTYPKFGGCKVNRKDKNNDPQNEKNTTAKTTMNLVMSLLMILAKVFVYNPVVLMKHK